MRSSQSFWAERIWAMRPAISDVPEAPAPRIAERHWRFAHESYSNIRRKSLASISAPTRWLRRCDCLGKEDTMADATMLTEETTKITARQRQNGVLIGVRKLARIFVVKVSVVKVSVFNIGVSLLCLTGTPVLAQLPNQTQTQAQTRQELLQDLDSG